MVRFEAMELNGLLPPFSSNSVARSHLSFMKPSWVVRTESNVRKKREKKPDPPCVDCEGSGRVDCYKCHGKGRTNNIDSEMLPKGEWPRWCRMEVALITAQAAMALENIDIICVLIS